MRTLVPASRLPLQGLPVLCWAKQVVPCSDRSDSLVMRSWCHVAVGDSDEWAGFATVECRQGKFVAGYRAMGPLRLSILVGGLDTLKLMDEDVEELKEPHCRPPPLLLRMVEAGQLGRNRVEALHVLRPDGPRKRRKARSEPRRCG